MSRSLGEVLVDRGVIDGDRLRAAQGMAEQRGESLGRTLVDLGAASEQQIVAAVAEQLGVPYADCSAGAVDPQAAQMLPRSVAQELVALPVGFTARGALVVACAEPGMSALDRVAEETGLPVEGALAVRADLLRAIDALTSDGGAGASAPAGPPRAGNGSGPHAAPTAAPGSASPRRQGGIVTEGAHGPLLAHEQELVLDLHDVMRTMRRAGASDLHLTVGTPPVMRVNGELETMQGLPRLGPEELRKLLYSILTQRQRETFENDLELDMAYAVPGECRFRVNIFQQRESVGAVMRVVASEIRSIEELGVPPQVKTFAGLQRGFVLVTGPTGSGKSTTLAALIDVVNRERAGHIMTVEDPIEFLHSHKRSLVNQRELGSDTHSFAAALKHVLRQDPDVILVGELRDLETIQVALTAAETGHLVFGTLHTQDAPQTVDRLIDVFPADQQEQIRVMLAGALQGVVCQQLLKTADGHGRVAACEVMIATPAIRNLIREGKTHQMYSSMQAGKSHGMITMDQSLATLVLAGRVAYAHALERCNNVPDFNRLCGRA